MRKGEREKNNNVRNNHQLSPICTRIRDWTHHLGMCPNWKSNPQPFGVWDNASTNWATQPGYKSLSLTLVSWRGFWGNSVVCVCVYFLIKPCIIFHPYKKTCEVMMSLVPLYRFRNWGSKRVWITCLTHSTLTTSAVLPPQRHSKGIIKEATWLIEWGRGGRQKRTGD